MKQALVIGAGPAGLMAAEALAEAGLQVVICEAMPSAGRKFLMAGKSGLNLTMDQEFGDFLSAYEARSAVLEPVLRAFGPEQVQDWAMGLGQEIFTGTSRRVFPKAMKASPLLRAWLRRLDGMGVTLKTRHRWAGFCEGGSAFDTPDGRVEIAADVSILAMGGASWRRLGSDGAWAAHFDEIEPFAPANVGVQVAWSQFMAAQFGQPVKGAALTAGDLRVRGEFVVSERGLEGGGIYAVSKAVRGGAALAIDLLADRTLDEVKVALAKPRGKDTLSNHLRKRVKLDAVKRALVMEFARGVPMEELAGKIKALPIVHEGLRPIDEAISTAGGLRFEALDAGLMLRARPGVFCAGEMLDWEAPTGGYLITACLASGRWAGRAAADWTG